MHINFTSNSSLHERYLALEDHPNDCKELFLKVSMDDSVLI